MDIYACLLQASPTGQNIEKVIGFPTFSVVFRVKETLTALNPLCETLPVYATLNNFTPTEFKGYVG
jgi:hypothetical protein